MINNLHPDDLLFFNEVRTAMKRVAAKYNLPLQSIEALPMPLKGMSDRLGDCSRSGQIRIVMRCTVDGQWCDAPMSPKEVWDTAAHELAHLRHHNHGVAFQEFEEELQEAMTHQQVDHRAKVLDKLVKLQASRQSEAEIGNAEAAEAFASMINKMLIEYELNPSDIDYARATDHDPVIEIPVNLGRYKIDEKKSRIAWQETLAGVVANAHLCSFFIRTGSNRIWFVGTQSHATVAEYVYGTLVPAADKMCTTEYFRYYSKCRFVDKDLTKTHGFKSAWINAFVSRIAERFKEARAAAVTAAGADVPGGSSTALVRLNGALVKVKSYEDNKFKPVKGKKKKVIHALNGGRSNHRDGRAMGRAAADAMVLGRKGVTGSTTASKRIGDGR